MSQLPRVGSPVLRHPVRTGVQLALALLVIVAAVEVRLHLLFAFFAAVVATLLSYPIDLFGRVMPRAVATALTLLALVGALTGVGFLTVPVVARQAHELSVQLPAAAQRLQAWWERTRHQGPMAGMPNQEQLASTVAQGASKEVGAAAAKLPAVALSAAEIVWGCVLLLVMAFFLAARPGAYLDGARALVPPAHRDVFAETVRRVGRTLRRWTGGILISMTVMGALTALGLLVLGVDEWLTLALLTFLGTFVPYAGAIASSLPALAVALASSPTQFWEVAALYVVVHHVEGYLVQPLIMRRTVEIRPALLLLWQVVMAGLFGVIGVIVATPLLACIQTAVRYLYIERHTDVSPLECAHP